MHTDRDLNDKHTFVNSYPHTLAAYRLCLFVCVCVWLVEISKRCCRPSQRLTIESANSLDQNKAARERSEESNLLCLC